MAFKTPAPKPPPPRAPGRVRADEIQVGDVVDHKHRKLEVRFAMKGDDGKVSVSFSNGDRERYPASHEFWVTGGPSKS